MTEHKRIAVCSYKGGVGTSAVCANLTAALVRHGSRCMLADLTPCGRGATYYMGASDRVLYDIGDVAANGASVSDSVIRMGELYGMYVMPGVFSSPLPDSETVEKIMRDAEEELMLDTVVIDIRASELSLVAPFVSEVIVVSDESTLSLSCAARAAIEADRCGVDDIHLIINRLECGKGARPVASMIDETGIPLIAVVPNDSTFGAICDRGMTVFDEDMDSMCAVAFSNAASRLRGEHVPLLSGIRGISRKKILGI